MPEFAFGRTEALNAISQTKANGRDWLYNQYPKPGGKRRQSSTGFLMHEGTAYPVKPLGRLASEIAGYPMKGNPITNVFRAHFANLGFQLINSPEDEADDAEKRQRCLADVWDRPDQAKFRRDVFVSLGAKCLITDAKRFWHLRRHIFYRSLRVEPTMFGMEFLFAQIYIACLMQMLFI